MFTTLKSDLSARFRTYAASFGRPGEALPFAMSLKISHTFDVCRIMDRIAATEESDPRRRLICWLCALFHDVSRFEQYRDYQTFRDDRSFDHGDRSRQIFEQDFSIPELTAEERQIIALAVAWHNKIRLPQDLKPEAEGPARAVRDADKISIMKVLEAHFARPKMEQVRAINFDMTDTSDFSEELVQLVLSGQSVPHSALRNLNDFKISIYGWTADFNFPESARMVLEGNHYEKIRSFLPESALLDRMHETCISRLERLAAGKEKE